MTMTTPFNPHRTTAGLSAPAGAYDNFLSSLRDGDRKNVERHLALCDAEPTSDHGRLWKRIVCSLAALAPHAIRTVGHRAVQFFAADGKYRIQVFALEALRQGSLHIYIVDVRDEAVRTGVLAPAATVEDGEPSVHPLADDLAQSLMVEPLTAALTSMAPDYYRHMLGWNRKALRIALPITASPEQIRAVEAMCSLAASPIARRGTAAASV